jgi:protein-S-isoprenylcysteine O-methyltransferase Ste14
MFVSAGTLDWPGAWIFLGEWGGVGFALLGWLACHDPALLKESMGSIIQKGQTFWDKVFMSVMAVIWFGWLILMALDAKRWRLSHMPEALIGIGAVLILVGFFVVWLTFRENSFAAPMTRIQQERGQKVIDSGPYAVVRHLMYAGSLLYLAGMPLLLGSWLGLAVLPVMALFLTVRLFIEEHELRKGLAGYSDYAARVRYRLVPYLW